MTYSETRLSQGSPVPWPSHWRTVPLWSMYERVKDVDHPDENLLSVYREHGVVKREGRDDNFNKASLDRSIYQLVHPGWFAVNRMKAWQGSVGISSFRGIVSGHYICFRPTHDEDDRFLNWLLRSAPYTAEYASLSRGVRPNQVEIDNEWLRSLRIMLPPLEEQRRIADFLDAETARIDRLITASHKQSDLIIERFTESLRVLTTTAGLDEVTATGISWMPEMASAWKLMKIGRCFTTSSGTTPRSSDVTYFDGPHFWVNTGDLRDGAIEQPRKTVADAALADYPTLRIYAPGSLVVAMYGATTGRVGILKVPACVNQACCVLSELGPLSSRYAFLWFRAHREEILKLASGGGQPNISQDLVRGLRIPAPSRHEQGEIVHQANSLESMSSRQQQFQMRRAELLTERRQALITAAVTGQFDVTTASGRNVTDGVTA
ncbi:restriction endonuclease subunit S [Streptomyces sp. NPDC005481]|uniref:restriction endonuclease subunit S n=1 Tax=Streptomyces sp. NPDC005481 TaxID=3154881 RepID=UPI0033B9B537